MRAAHLRAGDSGFTVLFVRTQSSLTFPTPCRLLHSTSSPSAPTPIYPSMVLKPTISKLSESRAPHLVRPKRYPTSRSDLPPSPGFATPSLMLSTPLRGLRRSALPSSTSSGPSTRPRHSGRTLLLANRIFIGWRTWSPCSSRPTYPLLPLLLRLLCRSTLVVASILRACRPLNKPWRPLLRRPLPYLSLPRPLSTSLGRGAG